MDRVFKRKIYDRLLQWKHNRDGKTAIMIEGARRVGKSTIVEQFAKNEYESYILIDFNKVSPEVKNLFNDLSDLNFIFLQLQATFHVILKERRSVIIFDEVQNCPLARQAIKYLVADHKYDYIETGSLISIKKNTKGITIPSEEERVTMFPMDYEEFRWATMNDFASFQLYKSFFENKMSLGAAHRKNMREFRLYMLVGGMPQAVNEYLDTNNLSMVDLVKRDIIKLYRDDFLKLDPSGRIERMYLSLPSQLSQTDNRFKPFQVLGQVQDEKLVELLKDIDDSKCVLFCRHTNDPNVGLAASLSDSRFKIYCGDTGLFVTLAFWDKDYTENIIYQKLLNDKLSVNLGYVYENIVAQMLAASGNELFYYTWQKSEEDKNHKYEIDFLLSRGFKIHPVEVKSSGYRAHVSLDEFCKKFSHVIDKRYLIYTKDIQKDESTLMIPAYLTSLM